MTTTNAGMKKDMPTGELENISEVDDRNAEGEAEMA